MVECRYSTCATDSSNSSGSAPFSLAIFFRAVNILAIYQMLNSSLRIHEVGIRGCNNKLAHISSCNQPFSYCQYSNAGPTNQG